MSRIRNEQCVGLRMYEIAYGAQVRGRHTGTALAAGQDAAVGEGRAAPRTPQAGTYEDVDGVQRGWARITGQSICFGDRGLILNVKLSGNVK